MNAQAQPDNRPEPMEYMKEIDVGGQIFVVCLSFTRFGYFKAEIQMPYGTVYPMGDPFFSTEDEALSSAVHTAQRILDIRLSMEAAP